MGGCVIDSVERDHPLETLGILALAGLIALVSARDYAGGWNDGSRLATVECLVDHHTLAIDSSIFVKTPHSSNPAAPSPYASNERNLLENGTADKLLIQGHYYSDKSPVPALLMAVLYHAWQARTGLTARQQPGSFCRAMTVGSSGLAYVVAVWCIYRLGRVLRLARGLRLALTASFAFATLALPYVRHVNNHMLLLGVSAALVLNLARLMAECTRRASEGLAKPPRWRVGLVCNRQANTNSRQYRLALATGALAGLGYAIDLGCGPVLLVSTLALVAYRSHRLGAVGIFLLGTLPWLVLHHAVNYAVGGTFQPANSVAAYLEWPGSPFQAANMTGKLNHTPGHFLVYTTALLAGKRGFLGHNLPLFLLLPGFAVLLRRRLAERPEVLFAGCWFGGTWLLYALASTNSSGQCCSIRWFVPLLAPAYLVLALFLRGVPSYLPVFVLLSSWGAVLGAVMWWYGPWIPHMVPFFWPIQGAALLSWIGWAVRHAASRTNQAAAPEVFVHPQVIPEP